MVGKLISRIKGEEYNLDPDIPIIYLLRLIINKIVCIIYGMIRLKTVKLIMVHPSTKIKCSCKIHFGKALNIERGCYIDALSRDGLFLGNNVSMGYQTCIILTGSLKKIGTGVVIGDNVGLGSHGFYGCGVGKLFIGNNCIFGNYVSIHPENHIYTDISIPIREQGVRSSGGVYIDDDCWIGAKATILDGTKIGKGCIVAAGAVVKGEFPDNAIIGGVPAKIIKYRK